MNKLTLSAGNNRNKNGITFGRTEIENQNKSKDISDKGDNRSERTLIVIDI